MIVSMTHRFISDRLSYDVLRIRLNLNAYYYSRIIDNVVSLSSNLRFNMPQKNIFQTRKNKKCFRPLEYPSEIFRKFAYIR